MAFGENAMRLISYDDLSSKGVPYSKVQIWRLEKQKRFPKRVSIGPQRYAWVESEIDAWIAERIRERDGAARINNRTEFFAVGAAKKKPATLGECDGQIEDLKEVTGK
jgi:prophage regulatory protein